MANERKLGLRTDDVKLEQNWNKIDWSAIKSNTDQAESIEHIKDRGEFSSESSDIVFEGKDLTADLTKLVAATASLCMNGSFPGSKLNSMIEKVVDKYGNPNAVIK